MNKKRLTKITDSDLRKFPVWEFWTEDNQEFVRPSNKSEIFEEDDSSFLVFTTFTTTNGLIMSGFCSPQDSSGLDYIQPTICTELGQVVFWKFEEWTVDEKQNVLEKLNLSEADLFPIKFKSEIKCNGEFLHGILNTFYNS